MNPLDPKLTQGTFGELLVQLRLFQFNVQAAPPLKDTGNDLIAIRGDIFRAIQVKTVGFSDPITVKNPDRLYHIMALVILDPNCEGMHLLLDKCRIFLIPKNNVKTYYRIDELIQYELSGQTIDALF